MDSGDDEDRSDRMQLDEYDQDEGDTLKRELNVRESSFGRHAIPNGSDGEVRCHRPTLHSTSKLTSVADISP